jgi:DNA-binding response OmpR family regulator
MKSKQSKKRILIVDDEPDITESFGIALEDSGFEVDKFSDPAIALASFRPNLYNLLILDIKMPKMDGFELYDKIKDIDKSFLYQCVRNRPCSNKKAVSIIEN